jgi:flagellar basal body-associated protein FliL
VLLIVAAICAICAAVVWFGLLPSTAQGKKTEQG